MDKTIKVLLVDDNRFFLEQTEIFLERMDERIEVEISISAKEALDLIDVGDYDAIVSDYKIPEMDGLELLKTIRNDKNSDIPFILFTGKGREDIAMRAMDLGADRYLEKNGNPKSQYGMLVDAIEQEVEHYKMGKELEETLGSNEINLKLKKLELNITKLSMEVSEFNEDLESLI